MIVRLRGKISQSHRAVLPTDDVVVSVFHVICEHYDSTFARYFDTVKCCLKERKEEKKNIRRIKMNKRDSTRQLTRMEPSLREDMTTAGAHVMYVHEHVRRAVTAVVT